MAEGPLAKSCFQCGQNPRLEGDFMCRSCKEEHPMCYECGQRRRNIPFKLCFKCYDNQRKKRHPPGMPLLDSIQPVQGCGPGSGDDSLPVDSTGESTALFLCHWRMWVCPVLSGQTVSYLSLNW